MARKKKLTLLICLIAVLSLCLTAVLMYAFQAEIFDRSGWSTSENGLRYLDYYGRPQTGWLSVEGQKYYFEPAQGLMCTGWQALDGKRYYFDENGALHTGWLDDGDSRYYLAEDGTVCTGWLDADQERYYLSDDGVMRTGWLDTDQGRYYLGDDGAMHMGWLETAEGRFYLAEDGRMHTGWLDTDQGRYYLNETGNPHIGWLDAEDERYYMNETGVMYTGWLDWEEERYYLRDDGTMARGRVSIDGVNHYFSAAGKYVLVVNKWNPVPEDYEPELVKVGNWRVSAECAQALEEMMAACRKAGYSVQINSAYRSEDAQRKLWNKRYNGYISSGYSKDKATQLVQSSVADPGTSEHHLGLAVDLGSGSATYAWLEKHSWEYGFHLRYPEGKTEQTGIVYEPWHFRYLGKELAKELYDTGLTVEEYMDKLTKE